MAEPLKSGFFINRFIRGFLYFVQGGRFLFNHPKLIKYALIPWGISALLFIGIFFASYNYTDGLIDGIVSSLKNLLEHPGWWMVILKPFLWFAKFLIEVLWILLLMLVVSIVSFLILGNILSGPFHELLSAGVEKIYRGEAFEGNGNGFFRNLKRSLFEEAKKTFFFLAFGVMFWVLSILPAINVVAVPVSALFGILFLGLAFLDFPMERRRYPFADKRRLFTSNIFLMLGFGCSITLVMMIPILNFLSPPISVIAGTLLFLDLEGGSR